MHQNSVRQQMSQVLKQGVTPANIGVFTLQGVKQEIYGSAEFADFCGQILFGYPLAERSRLR